jgi:predicted transcriptional regulator
MLNSFFSSKMRIKLLRLFIHNPQRRFYLREISKLMEEPITPIRRELLNLKKVGFLRRTKVANLIFYDVRPDFLLYDEIKSMVEKTEHLEVT